MQTADPSFRPRVVANQHEAMLIRARQEAWPDSIAMGLQLDGAVPSDACQLSALERAKGHLLGIWSSIDQTFYHPRFQFLPCGAVHPRVGALLAALAENPEYTQAGDPGGWQRLAWLTQMREAFSAANLCRDSSPGSAPTGSHGDDARAAIDVFLAYPVAVIAFAQEDVSRMRQRDLWHG